MLLCRPCILLCPAVGILVAQLINYGTQYVKPYGWRISLAMGAVPALILFFGSMMLSDTPNSLVQRGRPEDGRKTLQRIRGTENVDVEVGARGWYCRFCAAVAWSAETASSLLFLRMSQVQTPYVCSRWF